MGGSEGGLGYVIAAGLEVELRRIALRNVKVLLQTFRFEMTLLVF